MAVKAFPANVVEHEMVNGAVLGCKALKEKGKVFLVDPRTTVPVVSRLPSMETTIFRVSFAPATCEMGDAFATCAKVRWASTRIDTEESVVEASSGR